MTKKAKYLILDTEATGLHSSTNCLLQVGIIIVDEKLNKLAEKVWEIELDSNSVIDPEAMAVNGINIENRLAQVSQNKFCLEFFEIVEKNFVVQPIIIAQFYPFDYSFLDAIFTKNGFGSRLSKEVLGNNFIDTKSLANYFNLKASINNLPVPFPVTSLSKDGGLADTLGIHGFKAHTALGDCQATLEVLKAYLKGSF